MTVHARCQWWIVSDGGVGLTFQEDHRCVNPRNGSKIDKTFSCSEDFAILEIGFANVDAVGAAVCWLNDIFVLLVRHGRCVLAMVKAIDDAMVVSGDQFEDS